MKTTRYFLTIALFLGIFNTGFAASASVYTDLPVVVIIENRVHLLLDETPNAPVEMQLKDAAGRVWHTHTFTLESEYWYTELPALPAGEFGVYIDGVKTATMRRKAADMKFSLKGIQSK